MTTALYLYVYMHKRACVSLGVQGHVCASVRRSEVNIRCWCLSLLLIILRDGVSLRTVLAERPAGQGTPAICLSLLSQDWDCRYTPHCVCFYVAVRDLNSGPKRTQQALYLPRYFLFL